MCVTSYSCWTNNEDVGVSFRRHDIPHLGIGEGEVGQEIRRSIWGYGCRSHTIPIR